MCPKNVQSTRTSPTRCTKTFQIYNVIMCTIARQNLQILKLLTYMVGIKFSNPFRGARGHLVYSNDVICTASHQKCAT